MSEELVVVLEKAWISKEDFYLIYGLRKTAANKEWIRINSKIVSDLKAKGKSLPPGVRMLPLELVLAELEPFGITRETILRRAHVRSENA